MKKLTAQLLACMALICLCVLPNRAGATHSAGGEVIYEHITDSTYRFFFKFYRDCTGAGQPGAVNICFFNPCSNARYDLPANIYTGLIPPGNPNGSPVSPGCSGYPTTCDPPSNPPATTPPLPGYREWWYATAPHTLVGKCDAWRFGVLINARNNSNNITGANFYVETTFNNAFAGDTNSSPYFSIKPIPYCCVNVPFTYNNGAIDPDQPDSLSHEVIQPLNNTLCNQVHAVSQWNNPPPLGFPPYGVPNNPLQASNGFTISPTTGQLSFTPTEIGPSTLTIRTLEWRRGVKIGSIMRDVQVQVLQHCNNIPVPPPVPGPPSSTTSLVNKRAIGCVGDNIGFTFSFSSPDPAAILIGKDNHSLIPALSTATVTYTGQYTPTVTGTFNWTATTPGIYVLVVTAMDSTCYPPGILYNYNDNFTIEVYAPVEGLGDTSICPGDAAQLRARNGGGDYVWSVIDGSMNSLISTAGTPVVATPFATTRYQVHARVTEKCTKNKDTVTVTMLPTAQFTPIPDVLTCPGVAVTLDPQIVQEPGVTYNVKWAPTTALASATGLTNVTTPQTDITYYVEISASNTQCKGYDTIVVDVLDGFMVFNGDTAICVGEQVQVNAVGDERYTYEWSANEVGTTFSNAAILRPIVIPSNKIGEIEVKLTAKFTGTVQCPDSVSRFKIDVQPIPTVKVNDDAIICYGDTMQMYSIVDPATYPKYSYSWDPGLAMDKPATPMPIFSALQPGITNIVLTVSTPAGCKGSDEVKLEVLPSDFMFLSNDTSICPDDTIQIAMVGVGLKSFQWAADNAISDVNSQTPNVWPATTKDFVVYGRDTNLCYDTQSVRIVVRPRAMLDLPDSVMLYPGQSYQMNPGGNALYYTWFPPVGLSRTDIADPVATPTVNTRYFVTAITESNCSVTDAIDILIAPDSKIDMPNAFTPGAGKTLKAVRIGDAKLKSLAVYNRWGVKMFETSDINEGWDGKYKDQPQPMGVYIYTIEAVTPAGKKFTKQGNITLVR